MAFHVAFVNCDDVIQEITPPIAAKNHFLLAGTYPHDAQLDYVGLPVRAKLSWGYNRGNLCLSFQAHILAPMKLPGR